VKAFDCQIQRLQSFVLDAIACLLPLWKPMQRVGQSATNSVNSATAAIKLVGNASSQISHYRRTRIIIKLPLVDDDKFFKEATPSLFGPEI